MFVWANSNDVRALATEGAFVWAATSGGLDRYDAASRVRVHFGVRDGLDSLDVRAVSVESGALVARTAFSACKLEGEVFTCARQLAPAANIPSGIRFRDAEASARVIAHGDTFIGTRERGVWVLPSGDASRAERLDSPEKQAPRSFVKKVITFQGHVYLGTFDDGLLRVGLETLAKDPSAIRDAESTHAPFRMVNDLSVGQGRLFVAANEGLFSSRDGDHFDRIDLGDTRAATGVAIRGDELHVTTTAAYWKIRVTKTSTKIEQSTWRPAGSKSLQAIAVSASNVWIASEDRGAILVTGRKVQSFDRLSGLPTSWGVDITEDGAGGVFMGTLRDGVVHVQPGGQWSRVVGLPSDWISSVSFDDGMLCVGTQGGGACTRDASLPSNIAFEGVADPRVHAVVRVAGVWVVGSEAGVVTEAENSPRT